MADELVAVQDNALQMAEAKKTAGEYLAAMGMNIAPKYREMFLNMASAYGLNPFKKEIYCIPYGDKVNIVTGYDTYIKRAERTGKLDGWHVDTTGSAKDGTLTATITINRKDWSHPFVHTVLFVEVCGNAPLWHKMPVFMTKKVAIGQGFRLCFPDELGGMPYTADEIDAEVRDITPPSDASGGEGASSYASKDEPPAQARTSLIGGQSGTSVVIGEPMPQEHSTKDKTQELIALFDKYGNSIGDAGKDVIKKALQNGGDAAITDALERTHNYLQKKGVEA